MREHEVGVTELRKRLGRYIKLVEKGNVIRITKYGKVIGYILPAKLYAEYKMADLVKKGEIHRGSKSLSPWEPVIRNEGEIMVSDLVVDERRKR